MLDATGVLALSHNWFKPGWVTAHGGLQGVVNDDGTSIVGNTPGFIAEASQDFHLSQTSDAVDEGTALPGGALPLLAST